MQTATVDDKQVRPVSGHSDHLGGGITMPTNVWEPDARLSSGPEQTSARKQAGYSSAVDPVRISLAVPGKSLRPRPPARDCDGEKNCDASRASERGVRLG